MANRKKATTTSISKPQEQQPTKKNSINFKSIHSARNAKSFNFAAYNKIQLENLIRSIRHTNSYSVYTKEDILRFLKNPESNAKQLRDASNCLYYTNIQYWRLIQYFAKMSPLAYTLSPVKYSTDTNLDKMKTCYTKAIDYLTTMNFRHEMQKVMTTVFKEDIFFGYCYILKDSFYIRKLDPKYCKISSSEDGCLCYAFDFSYFDMYREELDTYGADFQTLYDNYKKNSDLKWQELPSKKQFCIKLNEEVTYPSIPFAGTFDSLYELKDYKELQKAKSEIQNYKILGLKLDTDENGIVLAQDEDIEEYYGSLDNVLPSNIGCFLTPFDVKEFTFERAGAADTDLVDEATNNFMNASGVSNLLFNSKSSTSTSLSYSVTNDATIVYSLHRQIERNINRLLKQLSGTVKFAINIIDCTYYNINEKIDELLKLGQYGFPVRSQLAALAGMDTDLVGTCVLENQILGLSSLFDPLVAGSNMSSDLLEQTTGRPKTKSPSDKTLANNQSK